MPEYREFLSVDEIAKDYAIRRHREVNHHYNALYPYAYHLQMTVDIANMFLHLIPEEDRHDVIGGCWVHDIIEDARETLNNVISQTNETIGHYAYTCCNEKGKTRKERANKKYYNGIKSYKHCTFIKLCDRIANVTFSVTEKSSMINMYRKEYTFFTNNLRDGRFEEMWEYLDKLLNTE